MNETYTVVERTPTVEDYNRVRASAGLMVKDEIAAERGLANTLHAVCITCGETTVGIGRVIGDGGLFFDIVDIAVMAEHQRKGVGNMIMKSLMNYIEAHARPTALISLMANRGVAQFYERYGFRVRDPDMPAMQIRK